MNKLLNNAMWLTGILPLLGLSGGTMAENTVKKDSKTPNVIIVMTDDQGYGDFSFAGNPRVKTPNIDRLYNKSIVLNDFHVAPMCTPTRGQLMTGKDALHNGAFMVSSGYSFVYPEIPVMPEIMKAVGYKTALFGKWHLGDNYPFRPIDRGFDLSIWHKGGGVNATSDYWNNDYFDDYYWKNDSLQQFKGYCTDIWFNEAMKWMEDCNQKGKPFFSYLAVNAPHYPLFVEEKYRSPYKDLDHNLASFFGMIANFDENMGRLDSMLVNSGIKDNTILIFLTDNGGTFGSKFYNANMKGSKKSLYEGGHRVPCFIQFPKGNLKTPSKINEMLQVQDLLPTILDLCNIKTKYKFDGVSFADLIKGKEQPGLKSRMAVIQYGKQANFVLELPVKYDACILWNNWRLINNVELYNIDSDYGQTNDVSAQHPEIVKSMQNYYENWWKVSEDLVYNKPNYIHIGSKKESLTVLTAHDRQTLLTSVQSYNREGYNRTGKWNIYVEETGNYTIKLYRWPQEAKLRLCDEAPEYKGVDGIYPLGSAKPITRANLKIGIQEYSKEVTKNDTAAVFNLSLKKGFTQFETFFYSKRPDQLGGSNFVYITKDTQP
jgi:arylsulfatase